MASNRVGLPSGKMVGARCPQRAADTERGQARPCEVKQQQGTRKKQKMKKALTLFAAATIAVNVFGGLFDNVTKSVIGTLFPDEREHQRKAEAEERERKFWENNARIRAEQEERMRQEEAKRAEQEKAFWKENSRLRAEQEERARQREAKRAEQEKERERRRAAIIAEQEERARQEELRKAEEHKAYMARLEKEKQERRKQAQEAAQAERERQEAEMAELQRKREEKRQREENEKNHEIIVNYLSALRKDAGWMNKSVYLTKQTLANIPQFPSHPLMSGHVQLYKNVCSGSSLLWSIGQLANFGQYGSHFNVERPYSVPNASLQDYDGIAIPVNEVLLYCTVEGVDEVNVEEIGKGDFFDVEVFGFRKKFPREVTADDILSHTVAKYNDPKVTRNTTVTSTALLGHPGIVRTTTQTICEFINDAVMGNIGQESYEYGACSSDIARWYAYVEIACNLSPNHPLKVACRTQESILEADIAKGKYKKEIDAFNTNCIGWNGKTTTKEAFWAEIKAVEYAMSQYSRYNDRIQARADQMVADAAKSEEIKDMPKRGEAILYVFDKKAIDLLPPLKQKRCEAVRARKAAQKAEKERSIKNEALNF